ncbi:MAG TPA: FlgD immunoglobulin-like domain containing protein, partial [Propionibacteriaceae bacterium]|nr:FlgD immunoglobulin-like domain containing protein [Propionibacteriaceae bacterium]
MALASALAVGALTGAPLPAAASPVLTVTTPLPQGQVIPSSAAVFGSTLVWDTLRSSDGGTTWVADPALSESPVWTFIGGGKMARTASAGTTTTAYVYTPDTGDVQSYPIDSGPDSVNATYATYANAVLDLATRTATPLTPPSGAAATFWTHELGPSDALLWNGATDSAADLYAASTTPTATPSPWVEIPDVVGHQVTESDLLTLQATTSATTLCRRSLADFTAAPTCVSVLTGDHTSDTWTLTTLGSLSFVRLQGSTGTVDGAYVVDAALTTVTPVALPTGSTVLEALPGGSPELVVLDANGVPTVQTVAGNGSLTPSFTIPATRTISPYYLAVTPDRVVGGDPRDGSRSVQVWSRTVSGSGFGPETFLPVRASGLVASAGRTAVMGRNGVSVYDRGALQHTFADQASVNDVDLSGPYVAEMLVDSTGRPSTQVSTADGTAVAQYAGWTGGLYGSTYLEIVYDASSSGSVHVVVHDLTGAAADTTYTLPAGTADCYAGGTWGSELLLWCADGSQVYDYVSGKPIRSTPDWVEALGDGYAVVNDGSAYGVWNLATGVTTPLGCSSIGGVVATDGVGHVACTTSTDLVWSDFSALATHAPRLLGALANPTASFSVAASTWSLALDATKALTAGSVAIRNGAGTLVRSLPTAASTDGSVRVTWDGLNDAGKPVPPGKYSYTLAASATDGTGPVATIS